MDVIALIPKLASLARSDMDLLRFFFIVHLEQGVEVLESGTQNQLGSVRPVS